MSESAASLSIDDICDAFERAWQAGNAPAIESVLRDHPAVDQVRLTAELIAIEAFRRAKRGERVHADDYSSRFSELADRLPELLCDAVQIAPPGTMGGATEPTYIADPIAATVNRETVPLAGNPGHPHPGQLLGQYRLVKQLGAGGMGTVWEAVHTRLEKTVALKLLAPQLMSDPALVSRFEREMKAVGKLDHQHLVRAFDAGLDGGVHYLAMEYVDGTDLARYVRERGPLSVKQALHVMKQTTEGLAEAHRARMVHRDIKPANLMLTRKGVVKVMDLGLARLQGGGIAPHEGTLTAAGQILGTPDYMAPEQWDDTHAVDGRCDLYALGCTLFFLLTGSVPYRSQSSLMQKMRAHLAQPMPDLLSERRAALSRNPQTSPSSEPDLPESLVTIYRKLVEKDPEQRFRNADELLEALGAVAPSAATPSTASTPAVTKPPFTILTDVDLQAPSVVRRSKSTTPWAGVLITLAVILMVALGVAIVANLRKPESPSKPVAKKATEDAVPAAAAISWHGWPTDAPKPAIAPFDAARAKKHQEEWAVYLKVPVEYTNSIGMKFRLIPPGEFLMGSTPAEIEAALAVVGQERWQGPIQSEAPQHRVILTQPIYVGVHEVTQLQYEQFMGTNPSHFCPTGEGKESVAGMNTGHHPVEKVSWNAAAEFCAKLSQQEKLKPLYFRAGESMTSLDGTGYRLPSEAEWEFACRAGTTTKYWIGDRDEDLMRTAWVDKNSGNRTHAVGELKANSFGLFDVHGNVWEWVQDGWDATWYRQFQTKPAVDPNCPYNVSSKRVLRDSGWSLPAYHCRSSHRADDSPSYCSFDVGFRVAITVDAVRQLTAKPTSVAQTPDFAKERAVAEWVLSMGGKLELENPQTGVTSGLTDDPLSADPFLVKTIHIVANDKIRSADLNRLNGLSKLTTLNLPGATRLTDAGVSSLASISTLRGFDLSGISLTDNGLTPLSKLPLLESINVGGTQISTQGLLKLAENKRLNGMYVGGLPITIADLRRCAGHPLMGLIVQHTKIRTEDLVEITEIFPALTVLEAQHLLDPETPLTGEFFQSVAKHGVMESLWIGGRFESRALDELAKNNTLFVLTLDHWEGGDADLMRLTTMPKLVQLRLLSTNVTVEGVKKFHAARPDVKITGDFNLSAIVSAPRVPDFAKEREVAEWVLSLKGTVSISDPTGKYEVYVGRMPLPDRTFTVRGVSFMNDAPVHDVDLRRLQDLSELRALTLVGLSEITDACAPEIARLPTLQSLNFYGTRITDASIDDIATLPLLESLVLTKTQVTPAGLKRLSENRLTALNLGFLPITINDLRLFTKHPLRKLEISNSRIRYSDLDELVTLFPRLEWLDPRELAAPKANGLAPLAALPELKELMIKPADVTDHLKALPSLKRLTFYSEVIPAQTFLVIAEIPQVEQLDLVTPTLDADALSQLIATPHIRRLRLVRWQGGDTELQGLAKMPGLTHLILESTTVTAAGTQKFHEARPDVSIGGDFNLPGKRN